VRDMPSNISWVLEQLRDSTGTAREHARRLGEAVADSVPIGDDSIRLRLDRAQETAEESREVEEQAIEAAHEAKESADYALRVSERGRARIDEIERETTRERDLRIKKAEKEAEEALRRERQAAEAEAERRRGEVQAEVEAEIEEAAEAAEQARTRAEELVELARAKIAEARQLAQQVADEARQTAEEAGRYAAELSGDVEQSSAEAAARIGLVEELRERTAATAKRHPSRRRGRGGRGLLRSSTKADLLELASAAGIQGRSSMTKAQLVSALERTTRTSR
jgi:colicin import membrane protein